MNVTVINKDLPWRYDRMPQPERYILMLIEDRFVVGYWDYGVFKDKDHQEVPEPTQWFYLEGNHEE